MTLDSNTSKVFKIVLSSNLSSTLAGTGTNGFSGDYGPSSSAALSSPDDVFVANGNVYITDTSNSCLRVVE